MPFRYAEYEGVEGTYRFREVSDEFAFNHQNLGTVQFPDSFVDAFISDVKAAETYFGEGKHFFCR
ncbi:hypothetical protein GCM10023209_12720 [Roseibacterium beibuensis]|uniref:KTSC domain-containing protein n=1 Tax=[Roseibacterium] beibuensis TaxID=1193142 RepID=A0ABP9L712_9RHOB